MKEKIFKLLIANKVGHAKAWYLTRELLNLFTASESLQSDDEIKLTDNGFGSLEKALKEADDNVL